MRIAISILVVASSIIFASAGAARAQNATNPGAPAETKALGQGAGTQKAMPLLSKDECTAAGGKVVAIAATICGGSTNACSTTDEKGKTHIVCISKPR